MILGWDPDSEFDFLPFAIPNLDSDPVKSGIITPLVRVALAFPPPNKATILSENEPKRGQWPIRSAATRTISLTQGCYFSLGLDRFLESESQGVDSFALG